MTFTTLLLWGSMSHDLERFFFFLYVMKMFFVLTAFATRTISGNNWTPLICCEDWNRNSHRKTLFKCSGFTSNSLILSSHLRSSLHLRWRHTNPLFCRQLLSFQRPSGYISTQFSWATSPGWKAAFGSPWAQFRKPRGVWSVQAQPTRKTESEGSNLEVSAHFWSFVLWFLFPLTVVVSGEADPQVVVLGVVEVPDELHLRSAVDGRQLSSHRLTVVSRVRPGKTLLQVVHGVTVATVRNPEWRTLPVTGG